MRSSAEVACARKHDCPGQTYESVAQPKPPNVHEALVPCGSKTNSQDPGCGSLERLHGDLDGSGEL